jgi:hypothetical protein
MATVILAPLHTKLLLGWTSLAASAVQSSNTGNINETTLASVALPAGAVGPNGILRIFSLWSFTNNANSKTPRVKIGSANNLFNAVQTSVACLQLMSVIRNRNDQAVQVGQARNLAAAGGSTQAIASFTIDMSSSQTIDFTGQLTNVADVIALEAYSIELLYGA